MTAERIKEIQQSTAYPESVSVQQALLQVWNECAQEASQQRTEGIKEGFEAAREIDPLSNFQHNILYPTVDDYLNSK